jgi:hypothetical protein
LSCRSGKRAGAAVRPWQCQRRGKKSTGENRFQALLSKGEDDCV